MENIKDESRKKQESYTPVTDALVKKYGVEVAYLINFMIRLHKWAEKQNKAPWISLATICKLLKCSEPTAKRRLKEIQETKIIKLKPRVGRPCLFSVNKTYLPSSKKFPHKTDDLNLNTGQMLGGTPKILTPLNIINNTTQKGGTSTVPPSVGSSLLDSGEQQPPVRQFKQSIEQEKLTVVLNEYLERVGLKPVPYILKRIGEKFVELLPAFPGWSLEELARRCRAAVMKKNKEDYDDFSMLQEKPWFIHSDQIIRLVKKEYRESQDMKADRERWKEEEDEREENRKKKEDEELRIALQYDSSI